MKKQAKVQAFNQCNEERILYMNECMKLQNLLKVYGGSSMKKLFKGVRVTQTMVNDASKKRITNSKGSRSPTPPAAHERMEYHSGTENSEEAPRSGSNQRREESKLSGYLQIESARKESPQSFNDLLKKIRHLEDNIERLQAERDNKSLEVREKDDEIQKLLTELKYIQSDLAEKANLSN